MRLPSSRLAKWGLVLLILNEIRGAVVVASLLWLWFHNRP